MPGCLQEYATYTSGEREGERGREREKRRKALYATRDGAK